MRNIEDKDKQKKVELSLEKTRRGIFQRLEELFSGKGLIDEQLFTELEEILITSDLGPFTVDGYIEQLRDIAKSEEIENYTLLKQRLAELVLATLEQEHFEYHLNIEAGKLNVFLIVGVNGVGKTTSIGKLAHLLTAQGKKVMLAAGDTFRAGAIEQLELWGKRANVPVVKHQAGADPSAVVFDAIQSAKAKGIDVLICDTAGRLHNKANLMQELNKIYRTIRKDDETAPQETLLVLDASTGQNALVQARLFQEVAEVTGIILTKLDGTAKGGIIIPIANELGIPVKFITTGESVDDIEPFDAKIYIETIFGESLIN
jgi:fused signal recognition particle receptor